MKILIYLALILSTQITYSMRHARPPVPARKFSSKPTSISYSIKNPNLIASLKAARNAPRTTPPLPLSHTRYSVKDAPDYCPAKKPEPAQARRPTQHSQAYAPSVYVPDYPVASAMAHVMEGYVDYKIYKKIDEILNDDD